MRVYRRLLRHPGVARQVSVALVSRMTPPLLTLPLLLGVSQAYRSPPLAALMVGLYTATFAALMPVTGRLVDRWGGRVVLRVWLVLAVLALLGTGAVLAARPPVPVLAVSVVVLGAALPPVGAVTRAGWPVLVPPDELRAAYALDSITNEAATIGGPLLAAVALATLSPPVALLVAAGAIVVGSLGLPARVLDHPTRADGAARPLRPSGPLLCLYGIALCGSIGAGSVVVTAGALAADAAAPGLAGVLLAVVAVGAVLAGAVAGGRDVPAGVLPRRVVAYSGSLAVLFVALHLLLPVLQPRDGRPVTVAAVAGLYLVFGCLTGPRDALLQLGLVREASTAQRAVAFSWLAMGGLLGYGLGSAGSGATAAAFDAPFLVATVAALVGVALSLVLTRLQPAAVGDPAR